MNTEELEKLKELITNKETPAPIKALIGMYIDGTSSLQQAILRQAYLGNLIKEILLAPSNTLKKISYQTNLCPAVLNLPLIKPEIEVEEYIENQLYRIAIDEGWSLLTQLEAACVQRGISIGKQLNTPDDVIIALTIASIGQEIRELKEQEWRKLQ